MRWKPERANADVAPAELPAEPSEELGPQDRLSADLRSRGVPAAVADVLASRLHPELEGRPGAERDAALDGIALGFRAQSGVAEELTRSAGDLQEIERLMSSFAGELSKLDEVLEVLAAYVGRMRGSAPVPGSRILH